MGLKSTTCKLFKWHSEKNILKQKDVLMTIHWFLSCMVMAPLLIQFRCNILAGNRVVIKRNSTSYSRVYIVPGKKCKEITCCNDLVNTDFPAVSMSGTVRCVSCPQEIHCLVRATERYMHHCNITSSGSYNKFKRKMPEEWREAVNSSAQGKGEPRQGKWLLK